MQDLSRVTIIHLCSVSIWGEGSICWVCRKLAWRLIMRATCFHPEQPTSSFRQTFRCWTGCTAVLPKLVARKQVCVTHPVSPMQRVTSSMYH